MQCDQIIRLTGQKSKHRYPEFLLVLEGPGKQVWAVDIKRSAAPVLSRGFHIGSADIGATRKYVVYAGQERFPMPEQTEAIGLVDFLKLPGGGIASHLIVR